MTERVCPNCGSGRVRRGGTTIWGIYVLLIFLAIPAVLWLHLHAGLVAGAMLAAIVLAHLVVDQWACAECGEQFRS